MTVKQPRSTKSDSVTVEKPRLNRRLVGSDGELLVAVEVEKPKRQAADPSLNRRLLLMVAILVFGFSVVAIAVVVVQGIIKGAVPSSPTLGTVPARFANGPYEIGFVINKDENYPATLPCNSRQIKVKVGGATPVKAHLWTAPDHGSINTQVSISATKRTAIFDIPAPEGDSFNIEVIDAQGNPLSGLKDMQFGTKDFPFCELAVTFDPIRE